MDPAMQSVCAAWLAESRALAALCGTMDGAQWQAPTDFYGWTPWDEVAHLLFFDETAAQALADPAGFERDKLELEQAIAQGRGVRLIARERFGHLDGPALLRQWADCNEALAVSLLGLDAKARLPWYGPSMSARSFVTARLMETWAHGQDVYDLLGEPHESTGALQPIAHLGVTTYGWSFVNRQLTPPQPVPYVELQAPDGSRWTWGEPSDRDYVKGPAQDFALLVTQRRHRLDTRLRWAGAGAEQWTLLAQCFAGEPADGPAPGARRGPR
ncbi:MAG: TIGR03084 family metal-binding protein [Rubrivivax sp.]